jgi:uncharacterized RDD family membrane protein YckC
MASVAPAQPSQVVQPATQRPCPSCGRDFGAGLSCQFCRQLAGAPSGVLLSSPGKRLGGLLMEGLLLVVTLGIGYCVWLLFSFAKGQTPGKQVLGMRVLQLRTGRPASWGLMFLREVIAKPVVSVLSFITFGIVNFWLLWDDKHQQLYDKIVGTVVVDDPQRQLAPAHRAA